MGYIVDISKYQKDENFDWPEFGKHVDLLFIRIQFGSLSPDELYSSHCENAKKNGIPFGSYAFPAFVSVNDARVEARDAFNRQDKASKAIFIDIEPSYYDGEPTAITKLSQSVRLEGLKVYVDELRKLGQEKIGAYIAHHIYKEWDIDSIVGIFDFIIIPKYGINDGQPHEIPDYPCHLWQYSSRGIIPGYNGFLDLNTISGDKTLEWFIGEKKEEQPVSKPQHKPEAPKPQYYEDYKVKSGDTLWDIAKEHHVDFNELVQANKKYEKLLPIGVIVKIPRHGVKPQSHPKPQPHQSVVSGIKVVGHIQIVNVSHGAFICDRPSDHSKNLGIAKLGTVLPISGSVPGWYEVLYNGERAYVNDDFAKRV